MNGWAFLVGRGRHKGYRTVLAPDFLVVRNLHSLLSESAGGDSPDVDGRHTVEIDNDDVGHISLTYRTEQLRSGHLDGSDRDDELVLDEHGRPLELLYGVVSRHQPPSGVDERDLQRAREEAFSSYRRFLAEEDTFRVDGSSSFPLHGSEVPRSHADATHPASEHPRAADVHRPAAEIPVPDPEIPTPPDASAARASVGSPPTSAHGIKIFFVGAAVLVGAVLVALLLLWLIQSGRVKDVGVTVQQGDVAGCPELPKLVGTMTAKESNRVQYHWKTESGKAFGQGARDVKAGEQQTVEVNLPREPGGRPAQTGTYSLVIDQGTIDQLKATVTCSSAP